MAKVQSPCFGCVDDRSATCHASCELYIAYRREMDQERLERRRATDKEAMINGAFHRRKFFPKATKNSGR